MQNAIKMPTPMKPKIVKVHAAFKTGGMTVSHEFRNGGHQEFNFHSPEKAASHIKRVVHQQWLHPDENFAGKINNNLDTENA